MRWLRIHRRRGIALILALFTTAILIILSVSFLALALGESRNSRSAGYEGAAVQAANFGIGFCINYMGRGGAIPNQGAQPVWDDINNFDGLGFFNILHQPAQFPHNGYPIAVSHRATDSDPNTRTLSIGTGPAPAQLGLVPLGQSLQFTCSIDIIPLVNRGITSYRLLSTAEVWAKPQGAAPLARRVIEARVLEESVASYLHFISNGRSQNVQGQATGEIATVQNQILATNILIPPSYRENGPMRVDGQKTSGANATNLFAAAAGNLAFGPGDHALPPKFDDQLTIHALTNGYADSGLADQNSGFFKGGFSPGTVSLGLPDFDKAKSTLRLAAANITQSGKVNGLIQIPTSSIMGNGSIPPQYQARTTFTNAANGNEASAVGDPFIASFGPNEVPVAPDYRPRPPNVELKVNNDQVTITNVSTLDGSTLSSGTYNVTQFEKGVIYVEGGNAVIKGGVNATGQLTIVATERDTTAGPQPTPGREGIGANLLLDNAVGVINTDTQAGRDHLAAYNAAYNTTAVTNETLYSQSAKDALDFYQYEAEVIRATVNDPADRATAYASIKTPPYSVADLNALVGKTYPANPGNPSDNHQGRPILSSPIPAGANDRKFFPPPGSPGAAVNPSTGNLTMGSNGQPLLSDASPRVEREGNLILADDFKYNTADRSTSVGFLAQNFILLNDNTPADKQMTINGVLMSGERSVQLDWDNTGRQPVSTWQTMMTPGFNATFNLKGSIVGEYVDVEGDYNQRGYFNQSFEHDPQLQFQRPPYFPQWDFSQLPGGFRYVITHYVDRGSLSTEGAAQ